MKRMFVLDCCQIPLFLLVVLTGIGFFLAGNGFFPGQWPTFAKVHIIVCLVFTIFIISHIWLHWGWFKSLFKSGLGRKSRATVFVAIVFILLAITGYVQIGIKGPSPVGTIHFIIGVISVILFGSHIAKRIHILRKAMKK